MNVDKTVVMTCQPYRTDGRKSEVAYTRRITGEGPFYRERQRGGLRCLYCGTEISAGSMAAYRQTQHGQRQYPQLADAPLQPEAHRKYWLSFLRTVDSVACPVKGCRGGGNEYNQPLDTIHTPPHAGYDSDYVGGKPSPPPLPQLQQVDHVVGS